MEGEATVSHTDMRNVERTASVAYLPGGDAFGRSCYTAYALLSGNQEHLEGLEFLENLENLEHLEHLEILENLEILGKKRSPFLTVCGEGTSGKGGGDLLSRLRSTIGAAGLNFSVRNGKRWDPGAMTA